MKEKNKGITLIALIITVIILLILTALVIDFAIDGKIVDNAKQTQTDIQEIADGHNGIVDSVRNLYNFTNTGGEIEDPDTPDNPGNNLPVISAITLNAKTTTSFTINALATDADGENLIYNLYVEGINGIVDTKTVAQNTTVELTANNLEMYTDYNYYVIVSDDLSNVQSDTATVKTKCSGQTITCTTSECTAGTTTTCSNCGGDGQKTCETCTGSGSVTCSTCNRYWCGDLSWKDVVPFGLCTTVSELPVMLVVRQLVIRFMFVIVVLQESPFLYVKIAIQIFSMLRYLIMNVGET